MRDINLIPREYIDKRKRPVRVLLRLLLAMLAFFLMLYFYMVPQKTIKALEQEIKSYDEVVVEYNILKSKLEQVEQNEGIIRKRLQVLGDISAEEVKPTEVLELIKGAMPQDVLLTSMSYTSTDVSLTCVAETASGTTEFYVELGKLDKFGDFTMSPITKDDKGYNFTIQFSITAGSGENEKNQSK